MTISSALAQPILQVSRLRANAIDIAVVAHALQAVYASARRAAPCFVTSIDQTSGSST
jgi:hypothetical protein